MITDTSQVRSKLNGLEFLMKDDKHSSNELFFLSLDSSVQLRAGAIARPTVLGQAGTRVERIRSHSRGEPAGRQCKSGRRR